MFFLGGGALLYHAAGYSLSAGLPVAGILSPFGDSAVPR